MMTAICCRMLLSEIVNKKRLIALAVICYITLC